MYMHTLNLVYYYVYFHYENILAESELFQRIHSILVLHRQCYSITYKGSKAFDLWDILQKQNDTWQMVLELKQRRLKPE